MRALLLLLPLPRPAAAAAAVPRDCVEWVTVCRAKDLPAGTQRVRIYLMNESGVAGFGKVKLAKLRATPAVPGHVSDDDDDDDNEDDDGAVADGKKRMFTGKHQLMGTAWVIRVCTTARCRACNNRLLRETCSASARCRRTRVCRGVSHSTRGASACFSAEEVKTRQGGDCGWRRSGRACQRRQNAGGRVWRLRGMGG